MINATLPSQSNGYPLFYVDADNKILCALCATSIQIDRDAGYSQPEIIASHINYDSCLSCDTCSDQLERVRGDSSRLNNSQNS